MNDLQTLLHKHIDLFLTPGLLEAQTMCAIFQDNATLCNEVSSIFNLVKVVAVSSNAVVNVTGEREGGSALRPEHRIPREACPISPLPSDHRQDRKPVHQVRKCKKKPSILPASDATKVNG